MNERSDSDRTRHAFDVLVAYRPNPPAGLTSPDTREAGALLRRIVSEPHAADKPRSLRRYLPIAVGTAAAAAAVGILTVAPGESSPRSAGSVATTPAEPNPVATEIPTADTTPTDEWPVIPESPPVGDENTARATVIYDNQVNAGRVDYVMVDGDVSVLLYGPVGAGGQLGGPADQGRPELTGAIAENRYVAGEWYYKLQGEDGDMQWSYDPNDDPIFVGVGPNDPRELYDHLAPAAGFEASGTDFVRGMETVHLVATTPAAIDPSLVQFDAEPAESVTSLELWLDSNGVVRRIDVMYAEPSMVAADANDDTIPPEDAETSATVSIEFYDIGEPITIEVPRGAVEIDAVG